jgi:hypothetical protein
MIRNGRIWMAEPNKNEKEQRKKTKRIKKKED